MDKQQDSKTTGYDINKDWQKPNFKLGESDEVQPQTTQINITPDSQQNISNDNGINEKPHIFRHLMIFVSIAILLLFSVSILYTNAEMDDKIKDIEQTSNQIEERKEALLERIKILELENKELLSRIERQKEEYEKSLNQGSYNNSELLELLEEQAKLNEEAEKLGVAKPNQITTTTSKKTTKSTSSPVTSTTTQTQTTPTPTPAPQPSPTPAPTPQPTPPVTAAS